MAETNCEKKSIETIKKNFASRAGRAIWKILCNGFKKLVQVIVDLLQVELAVVVPVANIAAVFIENFVLFPLQAARSTAVALDSSVAQPFEQMFDTSCPSHGRVVKHVKGATARVHQLRKSLDNLNDRAERRLDTLRNLGEEIQKAIDSLDALADIPCP